MFNEKLMKNESKVNLVRGYTRVAEMFVCKNATSFCEYSWDFINFKNQDLIYWTVA